MHQCDSGTPEHACQPYHVIHIHVRVRPVRSAGRPPVVRRAVRHLDTAHACSALDHPHIVQPRALIGAPPYVFVVTEHANGGDLFSLVGRAPGTRGLPAPAARYVFQQLMLALDFCRRQGVVIRNLDPRTLLLFWNNKGMPIVKLSDLTLAKDTAMQVRPRCLRPNFATAAPRGWIRLRRPK